VNRKEDRARSELRITISSGADRHFGGSRKQPDAFHPTVAELRELKGLHPTQGAHVVACGRSHKLGKPRSQAELDVRTQRSHANRPTDNSVHLRADFSTQPEVDNQGESYRAR
jgi:hypothetical protein